MTPQVISAPLFARGTDPTAKGDHAPARCDGPDDWVIRLVSEGACRRSKPPAPLEKFRGRVALKDGLRAVPDAQAFPGPEPPPTGSEALRPAHGRRAGVLAWPDTAQVPEVDLQAQPAPVDSASEARELARGGTTENALSGGDRWIAARPERADAGDVALRGPDRVARGRRSSGLRRRRRAPWLAATASQDPAGSTSDASTFPPMLPADAQRHASAACRPSATPARTVLISSRL
jgi:hypothetical protein